MFEIVDRLNVALAGRYRLERQIAKGGASIVFVADDLKHDRKVALKVLRPDIASTVGAERFLREIKIAAQLSHPHILPVHDSGEADGFLYYVMPLVEGESLRQRLSREHVLPVPDTINLLRDILDALDHAHKRGVVHRDIKPDNVMLTGRHALVTDFGVAKGLSAATSSADADTLGVAIGTPAYMAPEQAAADPAIDHRADLYSVGVLSYEMLSGSPPFRGGSPQAILAAHVTEDPVPVTTKRIGVPSELANLVMKCLEKQPDRRWQNAARALEQLGTEITPTEGTGVVSATLATPSPSARRYRKRAGILALISIVLLLVVAWFARDTEARSALRPILVVLPFDNLGPSQDEYFANGITDAITARLATLAGLGVISRTTAAQFQDSDKTPQEIAFEVGADYVLEGTIQRERPSDPQSKVRIIPQLIRASDNTHVWANTYDGDMIEVFKVQSEIAERVARAMDLTLLEPERSSWASRPTENVEAYDYYLKGHDYLEGTRGSGDANARRIAVEMFGRAVVLDSNFALAYAELSLAHIWLFRYFVDPTTERLSQARAAVDRALELDPDLPAAHLALGHYHYWGAVPNPDLALEEFKFVALREPNNAYARSLIGALQAAKGEWGEALANAALAADLDPSEPEWAARAGSFFLLARRYEEAEKYLNRSLALAPDLFDAHLNKIALHLLWHGDEARATQAVKNMGERVTAGQVATALVDVAPVLIASGDYDTLFTQLTPASISGPFSFDYLYVRAEFHRLRNQPERARVYYDSLLTVLRRVPHERAEDAVVNVLFGLAHAGLGQKTQAIQRAKTIESLVTANEDGLRSNRMLMSLAWIYGMVGDYDAAIDNIQHLLAVPSLVSVPYLRIAELPGNLKQHPRFRQLVNREVELPQTS